MGNAKPSLPARDGELAPLSNVSAQEKPAAHRGGAKEQDKQWKRPVQKYLCTVAMAPPDKLHDARQMKLTWTQSHKDH